MFRQSAQLLLPHMREPEASRCCRQRPAQHDSAGTTAQLQLNWLGQHGNLPSRNVMCLPESGAWACGQWEALVPCYVGSLGLCCPSETPIGSQMVRCRHGVVFGAGRTGRMLPCAGPPSPSLWPDLISLPCSSTCSSHCQAEHELMLFFSEKPAPCWHAEPLVLCPQRLPTVWCARKAWLRGIDWRTLVA
jgi:hypothetical protein